MREVELSLKGWKLADALGELRKWLDHNNCIPANFDTAPVLGQEGEDVGSILPDRRGSVT